MKEEKREVLWEIARERLKLAELDRARENLQHRIIGLESKLADSESTPGYPQTNQRSPDTPLRKVELFRSLFKGRPDVFPVRFESKKSGKAGYSPACANKWEPGVCLLKSGGKCSECSNQAFAAVSDKTILDHLQGRQVVGLYPLLEDETCWLLAVDFDKGAWKDDVAAFSKTCQSFGVQVATERSRSGNGAHAWFFFREPVAAHVAREMGCFF